MYKLVQKEDIIRIPAEYIRKGQSLNQHIDKLASTAFEGRFDDDNRFILVTLNHEPLGRGRIIHGDGAIYQNVRFDAILFCMDDYEVVEGAVSEVHEFGTFVRIGPMEALLHKSQIMEDHVDVNVGMGMIEGRQTGRRLQTGSTVRARIVSLSPNPSDPRQSKIGLTCKQPGLGGMEWIIDEREE
ncbi:MAG: DNA-directed RNA polymerase [Candidatus Poseidoniales archaeon]|jgi:DNA-directed RNA polymerase subunit E'